MIKKFQQGGKQEDAVMQFVKGIADTLQADPQQVIQAAQQNPDALKAAVQVYQETQDIQKAAQTFAQAIQGKAKKAEHGAKLEYVKGLKKTCAEDEELVYFKNGGKAGCGCKKKAKPVKKAKCGTAIEKFKKTLKKLDNVANFDNSKKIIILLIQLNKLKSWTCF